MPNDSKRDIVKSIEDALKVIDESDMAPAPVYERPFPQTSDRSVSDISRSSSIVNSGVKGITSTSDSKRDPEILRIAKNTKSGNVTTTDSSGISQTVKSYDSLSNVGVEKSNDSKESQDSHKELDIGPPDFKMKFDFESAYRDVPVDKPIRLRREKRTGLVGGLLLAIFIICVSLVLASLAWMATVDILGFAAEDEEVSVHVQPGFTLESITDMLYESGLIRHRALFIFYAEYSDAMDKISEGSFILNKNYDYRALVQGMTARAGTRVETTVTIPEGFTLAQIFALLDEAGVTPAEDLWYAATHYDFAFHFLDSDTLGNRLRLEGFLFPDTYNFFLDSTPVQAITRMLREFNRRFSEDYVERAAEMELSIRDVIIIASMIEREAGDDEERPRIAAVIYNRLESPNFPRLEIDATIHYAIAGTTIPFSTRVDSVFNTYIHEGLPPGPIANPGIASIRAALFPSSTNEFFYALNRYGTHNFFTNYDDHRNFVLSDEYGG